MELPEIIVKTYNLYKDSIGLLKQYHALSNENGSIANTLEMAEYVNQVEFFNLNTKKDVLGSIQTMDKDILSMTVTDFDSIEKRVDMINKDMIYSRTRCDYNANQAGGIMSQAVNLFGLYVKLKLLDKNKNIPQRSLDVAAKRLVKEARILVWASAGHDIQEMEKHFSALGVQISNYMSDDLQKQE
jgi:hypothetical protein